GYPMYPLPR
uniref:ORYZATENSIN=BIOACTIVE peptide n=1 Tax=Oryza sativa TaxID=4530 RepID=Q9S8J8_ORYSA|nr:oryzatensin=bioactive peptide [Oryza sativa=rice, var. japonica cv. Nipponbare, seeds, Peptide, 9 aa] [Oryza sativa]